MVPTSSPRADPKPLGQLALIGTPPDYQTSENHAGYGALTQRVATLKASYSMSAFDTKLILTEIRNKTYTNVDFDGSPRPARAAGRDRPAPPGSAPGPHRS